MLVDSSKSAVDAYVLRRFTSLDLRIVHLVRDPRAVAWSWARRKAGGQPGSLLPTMSPVASSRQWLVRNLAVEGLLKPDFRLRYEDFAAAPRDAVGRIQAAVDSSPGRTAVFAGTRVTLGPNHTAAGNPSRFAIGDVAIGPDDEWKARMSASARRNVVLCTFPLLRRYGYRI